jgi:hypothetical protein
MTSSRIRLIGAVVSLVSLAALGVSVAAMVLRLDQHFERTPQIQWHTNRVFDTVFDFAGSDVSVETSGTLDDRRVVISWKGQTETLPVTGPEDTRLRELTQHERWLKALQMVSVPPGMTRDEALNSGEGEEVLVFVARERPESEELAEVPVTARKQASIERSYFRFVTLRPDGSMTFSEAPFEALEEFSYRRSAALTLLPKEPDLVDQGFEQLGWTWAAARVSVLTLVIGILLFASSFVRTDFREQAAP